MSNFSSLSMLSDFIAEHLSDARRGKNTQIPLAELFRQSVYSRIRGL